MRPGTWLDSSEATPDGTDGPETRARREEFAFDIVARRDTGRRPGSGAPGLDIRRLALPEHRDGQVHVAPCVCPQGTCGARGDHTAGSPAVPCIQTDKFKDCDAWQEGPQGTRKRGGAEHVFLFAMLAENRSGRRHRTTGKQCGRALSARASPTWSQRRHVRFGALMCARMALLGR